MAISFKEIPANLRVPGSYIEIDNSRSGSSESNKVVLLLCSLDATKVAAKTTVLYKPLRILSKKDAARQLGESSEGCKLASEFIALNDSLEIYALPMPVDMSGVDFTKDVWGLIEDFAFNWLVYPGDKLAQIQAIEAELEQRYNVKRQIGARCFYARSGAAADIVSFGKSRNSPHMSLLPLQKGADKVKWLARWAAALTKLLANDPSTSLNQTKITGLSGSDVFTFSERNNFLNSGISTWISDRSGAVYAERVITNYTETPEGVTDSSYLDIQVPETLDAIRRTINSETRKRYANAKLLSDGTPVEPGQIVVTPAGFRAFLLSLYERIFIAQKLWCQDSDTYKASLVVQINADDKNRLDYEHQPLLVGRFDIAAGKMYFS